MRLVSTKTTDQLDLQALHRVRERLVGQRPGIINQIRAFPLERGVAVRQGLRFLRFTSSWSRILLTSADAPLIGNPFRQEGRPRPDMRSVEANLQLNPFGGTLNHALRPVL
jgi:transposase